LLKHKKTKTPKTSFASLGGGTNSSGGGEGLLEGGVANEGAGVAPSQEARTTTVGVDANRATVLLNGAARVTASGVNGVVDAPEGRVLPAVGERAMRDLLGLVPLNRVVKLNDSKANHGGGDALGRGREVGGEGVCLLLSLYSGQASFSVLKADWQEGK